MQLLLKRGRKKTKTVRYLGTWHCICVLVIDIFIWQMQPMLDFQLAALVLGPEKILIHFNLITAQLGNIWDVLHTQTHQELKIFCWELILASNYQCEHPLELTNPLTVPAGASKDCPNWKLFNIFYPLYLLNRVHLQQPYNTSYLNQSIVGLCLVNSPSQLPWAIVKVPAWVQ